MSSSMLSPAMTFIAEDFHISSPIIKSMVVSIQILAWAFGPLIIALISEHDYIGRKLVLDVSCWMSLFFNLGCAFSQTTAQMMVCRFIGGLFGCVPMNVCAGVISDMFDAQSECSISWIFFSSIVRTSNCSCDIRFHSRSQTMALDILCLVYLQWICCYYGYFLFKETYSPTLLKRKAKNCENKRGMSIFTLSMKLLTGKQN